MRCVARLLMWGPPLRSPRLASPRLQVLEINGLRVFECPLHLEGGSIHSDGQGTLVVTAECLLDPSRNPHLGKEGIEKTLKDFLGLKKILWLWKGMAGDDHVVNGHVDNMATFSEPGTILLSWSDDPNDPQHEISKRNLEILEAETDAMGRRLKVIKLPCPSPGMFRSYKEADTMDPGAVRCAAGRQGGGSRQQAALQRGAAPMLCCAVIMHACQTTAALCTVCRFSVWCVAGLVIMAVEWHACMHGCSASRAQASGRLRVCRTQCMPCTRRMPARAVWQRPAPGSLVGRVRPALYRHVGRTAHSPLATRPSKSMPPPPSAPADHIKKGYVPREVGQRLAGSYINHYIANGGIVCPQFGGAQAKSDELAMEILQKAYPTRKVRIQPVRACLGLGMVGKAWACWACWA